MRRLVLALIAGAALVVVAQALADGESASVSPAGNITSHSATLYGSVSYGSDPPGYSYFKLQGGDQTVNFSQESAGEVSQTVTGLIPNTQYTYELFVVGCCFTSHDTHNKAHSGTE